MSRRVVSHPRSDSEGLIVEVPLTFRKRGGRKQMITPDGSRGPAGAPTVEVAGFGNVTLVRALARAHRWREMLENGCFNSITELAEAEGVNRSYLCRMLRLTLLSPEITTEVLDGRGAGFRLDGSCSRSALNGMSSSKHSTKPSCLPPIPGPCDGA